jgi:hypothetical protein
MFKSLFGQSKVKKLAFVARHAAFRRKSKDLLSRNQDNVEQRVYPQTGVSVSYKNLTQYVGLVQRGYNHHLMECSLFFSMI